MKQTRRASPVSDARQAPDGPRGRADLELQPEMATHANRNRSPRRIPYSFTEKKRIRKELRQARERAASAVPARNAARVVPRVPAGVHARRDQRKNEGLQAAFTSIFPISSHSGNARLEFVELLAAAPAFDVVECQQRGLTVLLRRCAPRSA